MPDQIIPIAKIHAAAMRAARAGQPQCPPEFLFVEHVWHDAYRLAKYELRCEVTA